MDNASQRNPNLDLRSEGRPSLLPGDDFSGPRPAWWWTGARPEDATCAGRRADGSIGSLPLLDLARCTRGDVLAYFDNTWVLTEILFAAIQGERTFYRPPYHRLRHPLVFYYAHPAALYVNKLRLAGLAESVNEDLETLFQTGVDEMSWDDLSQAEIDWPPLRDVTELRRSVYPLVRRVIETHPGLAADHPPITEESPLWALFMGMEHERIHLELSSVLIRELPIERVRRPEGWRGDHPSLAVTEIDDPLPGRDFPENPLAAVSETQVTLGKPRGWPSYGWDNEYGEKRVDVGAFRASRFLVSNGEFLAFVRDGGYRERRFWTDEGWSWRSFRNAKWPTFWVSHGPVGAHRYKLRTLFRIGPVPWSAPVEVNWHEARAYARWRSETEDGGAHHRVLTEAEHHAIRDELAKTPSGLLDDDRARNVNLAWGSQSSVDAFPPTQRGFHDVFGNVWEWCEDFFQPLPGFGAHPLYDDFSTPCFDGKHHVVLGGSFLSTGAEAAAFARFQFRPHFFQHAGFRLASSDRVDGPRDAAGGTAAAIANVYESSPLLDQYMMLHYGEPEEAMPFGFGPTDAVGFPERTAKLALDAANALGVSVTRALDLGCAVGRSSFELARAASHVLGVDSSAAFIEIANVMKATGEAPFQRHEEGDIVACSIARVPPDIDRARVTFRQADACALAADVGDFDVVLAANLLCRVPSPSAVLARMGGRGGLVRHGGILVVTSPYTWMESFTPRDSWLGGFSRDGREVPSLEGLHRALDADFELLEDAEVPLVIREHHRKYQYIVSHATVWRRRP